MFRKHTNLVGQRICAERKRSGLSQEALELAEVLSCFYDGAPLSSAEQILGKNASDLLAPLEQLENRGVFLKHTGSQEAIHFAHPKLREYIYNAQPVCRRASRHLAIGQSTQR